MLFGLFSQDVSDAYSFLCGLVLHTGRRMQTSICFGPIRLPSGPFRIENILLREFWKRAPLVTYIRLIGRAYGLAAHGTHGIPHSMYQWLKRV